MTLFQTNFTELQDCLKHKNKQENQRYFHAVFLKLLSQYLVFFKNYLSQFHSVPSFIFYLQHRRKFSLEVVEKRIIDSSVIFVCWGYAVRYFNQKSVKEKDLKRFFWLRCFVVPLSPL